MAIMQKTVDAAKQLVEVSPENYYFNDVKPALVETLKNVRYDDVLIKAVELAMNHADIHAVKKQYKLLAEDFSGIAYVLLNSKSQYTKEPLYLSATQEEKDIVNELGDKVAQLITVARGTPEPESVPQKEFKSRIGYDESKKENVIGQTTTI